MREDGLVFGRGLVGAQDEGEVFRNGPVNTDMSASEALGENVGAFEGLPGFVRIAALASGGGQLGGNVLEDQVFATHADSAVSSADFRVRCSAA